MKEREEEDKRKGEIERTQVKYMQMQEKLKKVILSKNNSILRLREKKIYFFWGGWG